MHFKKSKKQFQFARSILLFKSNQECIKYSQLSMCDVRRLILFHFYVLLDSIPSDILAQQIWMLPPQMWLYCIFICWFIRITNQAAIKNSLVNKCMFRQSRLCRKCRTTLTAFIFVDSKMLVQMFFVTSRLDISVGTILTIIHFIIVDTHVFIHCPFPPISRPTIWFRALVPKIVIGSLYMHLSMQIQLSLNI